MDLATTAYRRVHEQTLVAARVQCSVCGYENNPGNVGKHRRKAGHDTEGGDANVL